MDLIRKQRLNKLLDEIGRALDISEEQHTLVEQRYQAVAEHLSEEDSLLKNFEPDIIPQGSFLIGTMIKPIMADDELDVDLVCRLKGKEESWAQYNVKKQTGDQIKKDLRYERMLDEEGRRCWTLVYAESTKFHMDILPAIVGRNHYILLERSFSNLTKDNIDDLSIRITDKTLENYFTDTNVKNWLKSNPLGYAGWFNERKKTYVEQVRLLSESIKPLPKYQKDKAPLQRVVQILKRHRDITFGGDEDKPISIIITTLAAKAYRQESDITEAVTNILNRIPSYIKYVYNDKYKRDIAWIENPVNSEENFADKWPDTPRKEELFFQWLAKAQADFQDLETINFAQLYPRLRTVLGATVVREGFLKTGIDSLISEAYLPANFDSSLLKVSHREAPKWPLKLTNNVEIYGNYKHGKKKITLTTATVVPKFCDIYFVATTNVAKPFDVYWQVVNTGHDAQSRNGLRGAIVESKTSGVGGLIQKEFSGTLGSHWIQCYIVKNGICVAKSNEFLVTVG